MKWALDEYHVTPQEDLGGMTPLEKWREATGKDSPHAPQLPPDLDLFRDDFLAIPKDSDGTRIVRHDGTVELYNEVYVDESGALPRNVPLPVRFEPERMGIIKMLSPTLHKFIPLTRRPKSNITLVEIEYLNNQLTGRMKRVSEVRGRELLERQARIKQLVFQNKQERRAHLASARRQEVSDKIQPAPQLHPAQEEDIVETLPSTKFLEEIMRKSLTEEEKSDE